MILNDGNYLKSDMVKPGDTVKFLTEGEWVESTKFTYSDGTKKKDFIMQVKFNGTEYALRVNGTNRKALIAAYGRDSKNWVGFGAKLSVENVMVSGQMKKTIVMIPDKEILWKD